jgi:hypothetical protein
MRWLVVGACLAGCQFRAGGAIGRDGGSLVVDAASEQPPPEGPQSDCAWTYTPANFDPCMLPAPGTMPSADQTIDTDNLGSLPAMTSMQDDGVTLVVVHLVSLEVSGGWTITGSAALVLAVDGAVTIDSGASIAVSANSDDPMACTALTGNAGTNSTADGDGGAGAGNSGKGGNGDGSAKGTGGAVVNGVASMLSPLHGGCPGGGGGTDNSNGTPGVGGAGGGALEISSDSTIVIAGEIEAVGQGATGAASAKTGAGGGGGGGAIFVEGASVHLQIGAVLCGDGGSGGDGGGSTATGAPGDVSPCNDIAGALTMSQANNGGAGGGGGFGKSSNGVNGVNAQGGGHGGGGGGGGAAGWIRLGGPQMPTIDPGAVITPMQ